MSEKTGFRVRIWWAPTATPRAIGGEVSLVLSNITEIHYRYPQSYAARPERIAFESDIDGTGYTYNLADIKEFEARLPTQEAGNE